MTSRSNHRRNGSVLVVALVCLVVVMGLVGSLLQGTLRARRQLRAERDRRQADLLLRAGVMRAALRLAQEADYRGEIWTLRPADVVGTGEGVVTIKALRDADDQPWRVHVVAEYPQGGDLSIRRSRTILVSSKE